MALRRFVALLRASALARRAMAAAAAAGVRGKQGRACAMARVQELRAEAEASSRAIASCASARARDAQAMVLRCQRQAGAAAAVAAFRFRFAHDRMFSFLLRVGYGETAPKTPSPMEVLEYLLKLMGRAQRIHKIWENINHIIEWFEKLDPLLLAMLVSYIGPMLDYFAELIQIVENLVSTAPECLCPFLGIRGLPFEEFPVDEGLIGVISVAGKFAGMLLLIVSGLCICLIIDVIEVFSSASLTAKRIIEEAFTHSSFDCKILSKVIEYCSQTDKTRKAAAVPDAGSKFELNTFHRDFLKVNQSTLFDLILTANYLDIKELLDLTCQSVVADMIKGKTPEEIRMTFNTKKDLTPEDLRKKELLDLTCQMVAAMIKSKTPEEICKTFNIKTDFIKEDDLDIQEVLDLTSQTVADMIKGKTPDEIREIFFTKGGCTPEEEEAVRKENQWAFE